MKSSRNIAAVKGAVNAGVSVWRIPGAIINLYGKVVIPTLRETGCSTGSGWCSNKNRAQGIKIIAGITDPHVISAVAEVGEDLAVLRGAKRAVGTYGGNLIGIRT